MLEVFDKSRRRVAILHNAFGITEQERLNSIGYLDFSLPFDDPKTVYCRPFNFVRYNGGELYRIMPSKLTITDTGSITYRCEHVLATLIDRVLYGYHIIGNTGVYTPEVIRYVLSRQSDWVLGECDFNHEYEYGWEQESLLSALFSIAAPILNHRWVTDTSVYPWRISLKRLETEGKPEMYVRYSHNMTSYDRDSDPQNICTRLYPLGYGEGVNQLTIESVNGGVPYLQSPQKYIDEYGIIERVWVDRQYEDAASLKAAGVVMLAELQEPVVSYTVGYQDLGTENYGNAALGKRVRIIYPRVNKEVDTYITEITRRYDDLIKSTVTVANKTADIASTVADMADRMKIESTYAQGATQLYAQSLQANASSSNGAALNFYIPPEMRIVNKVICKIKMSAFRAYSQATENGGATTQTSTSGGGGTQTSSNGGGGTATSSNGGGTTTTTTATVLQSQNAQSVDTGGAGGSNHNHGIQPYAYLLYTNVWNGTQAIGTFEFAPSGAHIHGEHSHGLTILPHTHSMELLAHSHSVTISPHSHSVTIPAHSHSITPGIYLSGTSSSMKIRVNGAEKTTVNGSSTELDITEYLVGDDGKIPRGTWHTLEVVPNNLAYVAIDMFVQGFVQSRGSTAV